MTALWGAALLAGVSHRRPIVIRIGVGEAERTVDLPRSGVAAVDLQVGDARTLRLISMMQDVFCSQRVDE